MRRFSIRVVFALAMMAIAAVPIAVATQGAGAPTGVGQSQSTTSTINKTCPISGEPVDGSVVVEHDGKKVGLCCDGCRARFARWEPERKQDFVLAALQEAGVPGTGTGAASQPAAPERSGDLYTLTTCPVSGGKLGSMGDPVVKMIGGREVRFCCAGCIGKFEADHARFTKTIDAAMTKDQLPYYPAMTCVVSSEPLVEDGEDIAVDLVYANRLVRLCCRGCIKGFNREPAAFIAKLDEAVIRSQRVGYPLATCPVSGNDLGDEPVERVVAGRLVRFCCNGCIAKFDAAPATYLATLDEAWKKKGGPPRAATAAATTGAGR